MIGYRFLPPAEEEMIAASLFYEEQTEGLGAEFLDALQHLIDLVREYPHSAIRLVISGEQCCNDSHSH